MSRCMLNLAWKTAFNATHAIWGNSTHCYFAKFVYVVSRNCVQTNSYELITEKTAVLWYIYDIIYDIYDISFWMSKLKNMAKNEIVLHDPYSNALWGGGSTLTIRFFGRLPLIWSFFILQMFHAKINFRRKMRKASFVNNCARTVCSFREDFS